MKYLNWTRMALAACVICGVSPVASASPVLYNLTFTGGTTTPTGSFTYDSSLAVNPFSSFTVNEGGLHFNLTSAANGFTGNSLVGACKSSQSAAGLFHALTTAGCENLWFYDLIPPIDTEFELDVCSASGLACTDGSLLVVVSQVGAGPNDSGLVTAAQAGAPEPGTVSFAVLGLALLAIARARAKRRLHPRSEG